jgi:hypothetical protein
MSRNVTWQKGQDEIEYIMEKYSTQMREDMPSAIIDNILWAVAETDGPELANALITQYELSRPSNGSHEYFEDGQERNRVIHIDPDFEVPDEWRMKKRKKK